MLSEQKDTTVANFAIFIEKLKRKFVKPWNGHPLCCVGVRPDATLHFAS